MANKKKTTDQKIEKALEAIIASPADSVSVSESDGVSEFEFKNEQVGGGLIFEVVPMEIPAEEPEASAEPVATAKEKTDTPEPKREAEVRSDEFTIPDAFAISDKYNTPPTPDRPSTIWTTYVPRFTDVSDKYRMVDDPRPPRPEPEVKESTKAERVSPDAPTVDPIAEIDEAVDAVVVTMARETEDPESEKLNVYKFADDGEEKPEPEPAPERTVDDERRDIESLFVKPEPVAEPEPEPEPEPIAEPEPEPEPEKKNYLIPDPEGKDLSVVDYTSKNKYRKYTPIAPEGASDSPIEMPKKLATEFTHQLQRDAFKDRFLDSILSVKIRLVASLVFAGVLLVYELLAAFGVIGDTVFASSQNTGTLVMFDLLFVSCLFVLAIPETVRAFKYLFAGKPTPELSLTLGFIVLLAYSLVTMLAHLTDYPVYGVLFAILSLSAIASSYFRISGDFIAFKLISQNKEKRILDKIMTRSLPDENLALDGLVDEYKSRTTRIFRAGFITDFFKRTAKMAEDPRQTITMLSITFGVSVVAAAISYFLAGGLVAAMSAFALVYLLGMPAFAVLSHKLSYFQSQSYALSEESTVVGEDTYFSYSDVDVVAFEDTEIFGPDDVNLKRFMLYGDRDNMENAMRQMCSLFAVVGGPLHYIFANALDNRIRHNPATGAIIEEDGLSGDVSGKRIHAGTDEYMRRHGIAVPDAASGSDGRIDTTKIMYAAEGGEVYAKFYIRYSFSEEFTMLLPTLKEERIVPLIYTRDPNISNELLRTLSAGVDCMRVMKRLVPGSDEDKLYRRVSAGIVTYGDKINAINVVLLTKKYKRFSERLAGNEIWAMGAGTAIASLLAVFGALGNPWISVLAVLWQLGWCFVLHLSGKKTFLSESEKEKKS